MMELSGRTRLLDKGGPEFRYEHISDQMLAFERAGLIFVFNFNPSRSVTDYAIPLAPGKYRLLLDSDAREFGGHGRLAPRQVYLTMEAEGHAAAVRLYVPARTALVLERVVSRAPKAEA